MRWMAVAVAFALSAPLVSASERQRPLPDFFMERLFDGAERIKAGAAPTHGDRQRLALVGRDDMIADAIYAPVARPLCTPLERAGAPVDPVAEIRRRARASRLVIMNEAHDDAQSRALILQTLVALHGGGFDVYAAETLNRPVEARGPRWPRLSEGTYSYEPTFGEVLRRARALGFTFVAYEAEMPPRAPGDDDEARRIALRESMQSRNLMDRALRPMPMAYVFVHVGHHHVIEAPVVSKTGNATEWMASRLKRESGIDPLTIDQTSFQSPSDEPVVCALTGDVEKRRVLSTDVAIGLPKPTFENGRPNWRRALGQREVPVPVRLLSPTVWSIVEARYASEPTDAVPADRILLAPGEDLPLLLKPGKYRIESWTRESGWSELAENLVN